MDVIGNLDRIRTKLLDLSNRNRLLNFRETASSIRIIHELPDHTFDALVSEGSQFLLRPAADPEPEPAQEIKRRKDSKEARKFETTVANTSQQATLEFLTAAPDKVGEAKATEYSVELPTPDGEDDGSLTDLELQTPYDDSLFESKCRKVQQQARIALEETGTNMLFLAIGFLEWYESKDSEQILRAPLLLVPITIERVISGKKATCYRYGINYTGEEVETNLSLKERLSKDFDLILPELGEEPTAEDYLTKVNEMIVGIDRWRVAREMLIGLFSFSKLRMHKDLSPDSWPKNDGISDNKNIRILLGADAPEERPWGEDPGEDDETLEHTPQVLDADTSQRKAIAAAMRGENLVIIGPPGTGKSQTITNIIAAALNANKSVLFVAEKMAALDVVRRRLDQVGLGDFCLELHSWKTQKAKLLQDVNKRLLRRSKLANATDSAQTSLTRLGAKLSEYVRLVHDPIGKTGKTAFDAIWSAERLRKDTPNLFPKFTIDNADQIDSKEIEERCSILQDLAGFHIGTDKPDFGLWRGFRPIGYFPGDEAHITDVFNEIGLALKNYGAWIASTNQTVLDSELGNWSGIKTISAVPAGLIDEYPENWKHPLAQRLNVEASFESFGDFIEKITEHRTLLSSSRNVLTAVDNISRDQIGELIRECEQLNSVGYEQWSLLNFKEALSAVEALMGVVKKLLFLQAALSEFCPQTPKSLLEFEKAIGVLQYISSAPPDVKAHARIQHVSSASVSAYKEVRMLLHSYERALAEDAEFIALDRLPSLGEVDRISTTIRKRQDSSFCFISIRLFCARLSAQKFVKYQGLTKSKTLPDRLDRVTQIFRQIQEVEANPKWQEFIGPLFLGQKTEWERVFALISWSRQLRELVSSKAYAEAIIAKISELQDSLPRLVTELRDNIESARSMGHRLLENIPGIPESLSDETLPLEDQLRLLATLAHRFECIVEKLQQVVVDPKLSVRKIQQAAIQVRKASEMSRRISESASYRSCFGESFKGVNTGIDDTLPSYKWLQSLKKAGCSFRLTNWVMENAPENSQVLSRLASKAVETRQVVQNALVRLERFGEIDVDIFLCTTPDCIDGIRQVIEARGASISRLNLLADYLRVKQKACTRELVRIASALEEGVLSPTEIVPGYQRLYYEILVRQVVKAYPQFSEFSTKTHSRIRQEFKEMDRRHLNLMSQLIAEKVQRLPIPRGNGSGYVREYSEMSLLNHEIQKRKKHIPIRQLLFRAGCALKALKPCFLMSPLSVAQYLAPGYMKFDLVVMDEASQLRPEESIGAIARCGQVVVVGDPNQLPPTSFFIRTGEDSDEGTDAELTALDEAESILDVAGHGLCKRLMLTWHYRSRHESLITFSNHHFYDDRLVVFPSPVGDRKGFGIRSHFVEGAKYYEGKNVREAEVVAQAALEHLLKYPNKSLGIGTFNLEQRDVIDQLLENLFKSNPAVRAILEKMEQGSEPFFIKNLENIQGDERDVIFVSATYGPDRDSGKVFQRFGPINGPAGWRRLNVMFTRAKDRLELFTSMRPSDVIIGPTSSRGAGALKAYLEYSETGRLRDYGTVSDRAPDSDFEISVSRIIQSLGFEAVPQVGVAGYFVDIGVRHPQRSDEFVLGIECDGATYHSSKYARDRDRLREEVITNMGWVIHRIWSVDWYKNRESEVERIKKTLESCLS